VDAGVLRDAAQEKLPAYMVPAAFVALDALPLTPNGKVDRKALLALEAVRPDEGDAYVAPRDDLERRIAEIWAEVLGLERVGADTNFFELGGHSLLLAQVHGLLQESLDPDVTIIELFQFPTVGALAARLAAREESDREDQKNARTRNLAAGRQALMQRRRIRR
jgi:acyl carrier protein